MSVREGAGLLGEGLVSWGRERVSGLLAVAGRKLPLDLLSQVMDSVNCAFHGLVALIGNSSISGTEGGAVGGRPVGDCSTLTASEARNVR